MAIRNCILFLLLGTSFCAVGQLKGKLRVQLKQEIEAVSKSKRQDPDFKKAYHFFLANNNDSTIVYAGKYIQGKNADRRLRQFSIFFRANSFVQKGLLKEASSEFSKISKGFPLYPVVISQKANLALLKGDYEKSLELFLALKKRENLEEYGLIESSIDHNIGINYLHLERYDASEKYLLKSLDAQLIQGDTTLIVGTYMDVANLYYTQFKDDQAIPYFQKAYDLASKTKNYVLRQNAALNMAVVEENLKNFEKSIQFRKEHDRWKDSVNDQQKVWEIAQLEKKIAAETKQREIGLLERESAMKSKERNAVLIGAGVLLLVLVLLIFLYRLKVKANFVIAEQKKTLDRLNEFKNRLFSIVSHDLRSSVNGLRISTGKLREHTKGDGNLELKQLVDAQGAIANSTFGLLDNLLNWALLQSDEIYFHPENVKLSRVVDQVYINYTPLLDQKNIELKIEIEKSIKVYCDLDSLKIVLRNVLDNAIKFSQEGKAIEISAKLDADVCVLSIQDHGKGMSAQQVASVMNDSAKASKENESNERGTGLGVRLCKSFIEKNNGSFHIFSEQGKGTRIEIHLPNR